LRIRNYFFQNPDPLSWFTFPDWILSSWRLWIPLNIVKIYLSVWKFVLNLWSKIRIRIRTGSQLFTDSLDPDPDSRTQPRSTISGIGSLQFTSIFPSCVSSCLKRNMSSSVHRPWDFSSRFITSTVFKLLESNHFMWSYESQGFRASLFKRQCGQICLGFSHGFTSTKSKFWALIFQLLGPQASIPNYTSVFHVQKELLSES